MKIEILKIKKNNSFGFIKKYKSQILITIILLVLTILFVSNSYKYIGVVVDGIILYGTKVLPTLLPFIFITKILSNFEFIYFTCNKFSKLTKFLFNTRAISCYIFFMSIISGYPVGAKLTSEFYENKIIDSIDAQKILSFCSTSGPLFIIGTVGVGFFHNIIFGITIFIIHIVSSIINGIIFRNYKKSTFAQENKKEQLQNIKKFSLQECMYSSVVSVLMVGGFIIIFYVLIEILLDFNILFPIIKFFEFLGLENALSSGLIAGIIEITKGTSILATSSNLQLAFILTNFIISFSGISVLMQAATFLDKTHINKKLYIFQKFTHGLISLLLSILISFFIF